jgi:hypothetical protein
MQADTTMESQTALNLNLKLENIRIQSINANLAFEFEPNIPGQHLQSRVGIVGQQIGRSRTSPPIDPDTESFIFVSKFEFKFFNLPTADAVPPDELDQYPVVATIQAEIAAVYMGQALNGLDPTALNVWGIRNAVLHQWPYWRELCHSTLTRLGLPVVLMPLWNPPSHIELKEKYPLAEVALNVEPKPEKSKRARKKSS